MQIEPYTQEDGYRVWLSSDEQEELLNFYREEPEKQLAMRAGLHGLRVDEWKHIKTENIRELDSEEEAYKLRIQDGKTGFRETPISSEMVSQMRMLKNAKQVRQDESLISVGSRQRKRWVRKAGESLSEQTETEDWSHLSSHDLRRTWATTTYYKMGGSRAKELIMNWGGWTDEQTFINNYVGREPDGIAVEVMQEADLL
jgi:integrase